MHNMLTHDKVSKNNQIKSGILDDSTEALRIAVAQLETIEERLKEVDRLMEALMKESDEFRDNFSIIVSVKGVGLVTACCIILKTHNLKYMDDPRVFGNFAGVVPSQVEQSGTSVNGRRKVSRARDRETNAALSMAVNSALTWNPVIRGWHAECM